MKARLTRFATFGLVGVVNTVVYYATYLPLVPFLPYLMAHVVSWLVSTFASFFLSCRFTFHVRPTWHRALLFPLTSSPNLLFTSVGVVLLVEVFGVPTRVAPLLAGLLAIPLTFLAQREVLLQPGRRWAVLRSVGSRGRLRPSGRADTPSVQAGDRRAEGSQGQG